MGPVEPHGGDLPVELVETVLVLSDYLGDSGLAELVEELSRPPRGAKPPSTSKRAHWLAVCAGAHATALGAKMPLANQIRVGVEPWLYLQGLKLRPGVVVQVPTEDRWVRARGWHAYVGPEELRHAAAELIPLWERAVEAHRDGDLVGVVSLLAYASTIEAEVTPCATTTDRLWLQLVGGAQAGSL